MSLPRDRSVGNGLRSPSTSTVPIPLARKASSSTGRRRRSVGTYKESGFSVPSASSNAIGTSPNTARSPSQATFELDDEDDYAASVAELRSKGITAKRSKKSQELVFQCEKCSKWYRHPACLVKHRWQHTDYWQQAASLMMSKHQSVMLLEAAAILTNGSALPEEKSLWPAAVSPPSSGLLGSEYLNSATMRPPNSVYAAPSPEALFTSFSLPAPSLDMAHSDQGKRDLSSLHEGESGSDDMLVDIEEEDDEQMLDGENAKTSLSNAPADDEIFAMDDDFDSLAISQAPQAGRNSRASTAGTDEKDSGYSSGRHTALSTNPCPSNVDAHSPPVSSGITHVFMPRPPVPSNGRRPATYAYAERGFGISAPQLGFFEKRKCEVPTSNASTTASAVATTRTNGFNTAHAT